MATFDTRWKQDLIAAIVLMVSMLCCFHRLVLSPTGMVVGPQNGGRNDLTASILPSRGVLRNALHRSGEWPLWQPYELTGIPWWGNPQSAMLYPPNWLYLLTNHVALASWLMAAHLWFGGLGVYYYCRKLELNWAASLVAGCGYLGAPFLIANVCEGHYNPICIAGWMPWALIAFERLLRGERGGLFLLPVILSLCFFAGHVQELFYLILILSCWLVAACLRPQSPSRPTRQTLLKNWCLVGVATIALTSVELIPIYAYTKQAVRSSGLSVESAARFSLNDTSLWQLVDPLIIHGPDTPTVSGRFYWETVCHFGLGLTLLAVIGVVAGWNRYGAKRIFVTLVLCVLFGVGTATPFFAILFHYVPGVSYFRGASRILMHLSLWVSLLAGYGVQALLSRSSEGASKRMTYGVGAIAVLASLLILVFVINPAGWNFQPPDAASVRDFNSWTICLGAGGFLVVCVLARIRQSRWALFAATVAIAVVTVENSFHARHVLRVVPPEQFRSDSEIVQFLKEHIGNSRVMASQELLSDWEAWEHSIQKVHGYEPVPPVRAVVMIDALTPDRSPQDELIGLQTPHPVAYRQNVLNHIGVKYVVLPPGGPLLPKNWKLVSRGKIPPAVALEKDAPLLGFEIWENTSVLPRAFLLGTTQPLQSEKTLSEQFASLEAQKSVLVSKDVLRDGPRPSFSEATLIKSSVNHQVLEATLDAPGYLVVTDLFAPGWRVKVDGTPQTVFPINAIFRGVPLAEGLHQIEFSYTPPGLWSGALISASTLLALLIGAVLLTGEPQNDPQDSNP